jgi:type IX secretion system PorP/SprF family membrane protein
MRKLTFTVVLAVSLGGSTSTLAQDVHFSQMEFSPLTLNPALAGVNSKIQGIVNYRNQWNSVAIPYQTIAASFDARLNENKRNRNGVLAAGINFFNDQAGDLRVSSNLVNLHLAYHLILDRSSTLGLGIYGGFGQRSLDPVGGKWGNQYNGLAFDPTIASGETFNSSSFLYADAGAGFVYSYKRPNGYITQNNQFNLTYGLALYHVNRPSYSFINKDQEKLFMRWSAFINADIGISNTRGSVLPGIYFQRQKSSMEIMYGLHYRYMLQEGSKITGRKKPMALYVGIFNRFKDAMVGKIMFEIHEFSAGFAYDINISKLTEVSRARGGFELFIRYDMGDIRAIRK